MTLAPLLRVEIVPDAELGGGPWAAVLFTSANGVRALAAHPRRGELVVLPALAVGQASAAAARSAGFTDVTSANGDGGDLARLAATRFAAAAEPLLYLAGEERARDLGGEPAASGLQIATVVVYRTVKAAAFPQSVYGSARGGRDRRRAAFFQAQRGELSRLLPECGRAGPGAGALLPVGARGRAAPGRRRGENSHRGPSR